MKKIEFLNLNRLHGPLRPEFEQVFRRTADQSSFIQGEDCIEFEREFADWVGPDNFFVGCGNGTDAIGIAARALGLSAGDEAIVPAMSFVATVEPLLAMGMKVRAVDVSADTWLMDPAALHREIGPKTKLVVPVHLYGQMAPVDEIIEISRKHGALVLEDSAQAHGARWRGKPVGYFGDIATYSFFPGKNLGAFGDAGGILCRVLERSRMAKAISMHGGLKKYEHEYLGCNSRMDTLQAGLLRVKLKHLTHWNEARRRVAENYQEGLSAVDGLRLPKVADGAEHVFHLYVVLVENRDVFIKFLNENGISTGVHYPKALHQLPALRSTFAGGKFHHAEDVAAHGVSLPMCPTLTSEETEYVIETVKRYFK